MTLSVIAYVRLDDGSTKDLTEIGSPESMAGFEAYRSSLYGSIEMRNLGATLLPQLRYTDLWVEGEDLPQLKTEVEKAIQTFSQDIEKQSNIDRLENIMGAILLAEQKQGGVFIG